MAKRKDISAILNNAEMDDDKKITAILGIIHDEVDTVKDEKDELQNKLTAAEKDRDAYKSKAEKAESDFTTYKGEQAAKETKSAKEAAYRKLLTESGIKDEKVLSAVLKATEFDSIELDDKGEIKDSNKAKEDIKNNWSGFITADHKQGQNVITPPKDGKSSGSGKSKEEIMAMKDATARQAAIAENHELFGF